MVDGYVAFEQFRSSGVGVRRVDRQGTVLRVHRQLAAARDGTAAAEYVAVRSDVMEPGLTFPEMATERLSAAAVPSNVTWSPV